MKNGLLEPWEIAALKVDGVKYEGNGIFRNKEGEVYGIDWLYEDAVDDAPVTTTMHVHYLLRAKLYDLADEEVVSGDELLNRMRRYIEELQRDGLPTNHIPHPTALVVNS